MNREVRKDLDKCVIRKGRRKKGNGKDFKANKAVVIDVTKENGVLREKDKHRVCQRLKEYFAKGRIIVINNNNNKGE